MLDVDALKAQGRWFEAAALYADALSADIASTSNWVQLGHTLKEAGVLDEAETAYRSAIAGNGAEPDPWLHLGHLLKMQNRLEDALATFETLSTFPHPPDVTQEIRGLQVALLPANRVLRRHGIVENRSELPVRLKEVFEHRQSLLRDALAADRKANAKQAASSTPLGWRRDPKARLVPCAHLVIRDGLFVSTTANPQFDIILDQPIGGEWMEIEIGLEAEVPFVEPVLLIEHAPRWQTFTYARLRPRHGRFHAICFLREPALNLRLNPLQFEGTFTVTFFALRTIGLFKAIRNAQQLAPEAATNLILNGFRTGGWRAFKENLANRLAYRGLSPYERWTASHHVTTAQYESQRREAGRWANRPCFSIFLLCDPSDNILIEATISSLKQQSYPFWSLSIVSSRPLTDFDRRYLQFACKGVSHVVLHETITSAVSALEHEYVVGVHAGNLLSRAALFRFGEAIVADKKIDLIYSDEDSLRDSKRYDPLFKPDWDPDFQDATGYVGDFVAIRRDLLKDFHLDTSSSESWPAIASDILKKLSNEHVVHIAEILHHRRLPPAKRKAPHAIALSPPVCKAWPRVSLVIPTRDSVDLLRQCVNSLRTNTDYPNFEIVVIDNESTEPETFSYLDEGVRVEDFSVVRVPGPFNFSRLNNIAIDHACGSIIGMINNDILAIEPTWLKVMVAEATRPEIGAVGAKLVYPSGHVQHAGIACGVGLVAAHPHKFRSSDDAGYMNRLIAKHRVSAVTAACLVVEKTKYLEVGGMDEEHLQVAFNDVDLCLKLGKAGYYNLIAPQALLIHLESATRGLDITAEKAARYLEEAETMLRLWRSNIQHDPYYNFNLTRKREDNSFDI